ncbi:MbcA/ParS/Xre antitoxin family protein [Alteromonas sp. ASW11-36]|uniref:MbcA/ParS/Xre antitoxin family protein n=1 Tax=Alteromonas arenosi TaxID=3055817 RepID=A0ABT7T1Q8_9ALTE|nr:MbcA/ParS/Xre antitoxin family protein [Alteromonas sp. ASW11-36]MDM7862159.1 MbcA/ParS/Xre antitoxin family protein [Alteromonas sp. ASW11-36]
MDVFAFRVFDMRDRFPAPFPTALSALEALYSDKASMSELTGEILAYDLECREFKIPEQFFIQKVPRFKNQEEAREWLKERDSMSEDPNVRRLCGIIVANPNDSFEKQLQDAMAFQDAILIRDKPLSLIAGEIENWLANQSPSAFSANTLRKDYVSAAYQEIWQVLLKCDQSALEKVVEFREHAQVSDSLPEPISINDFVIRILIDPKYRPEPLKIAFICDEKASGELLKIVCNTMSKVLLVTLFSTSKEGLELFNKQQKLSVDQTESIVGLCLIWSQMMDFYGNKSEYTTQWLTRVKTPLGGHIPIVLMRSAFGRDAVQALLDRLAHGDLS